MAVEQTLILAKPDAVRRSLAGEIVARFERRGFTAARGAAAGRRPRARRGALRRAHGEAVLRRARRLHHLGADARVRARRRRRDRDRAHDDRRDESRGRRARLAARRLRARRCRTTSCTAPTRPSRPRARSRSGFPTALSEPDYVAVNRAAWTKANADYTDAKARRRLVGGGDHLGHDPRARVGRSRAAGGRRQGRRRARLRHRVLRRLAGAARRARRRRRRHAGAARDGAPAGGASSGSGCVRRGERRGDRAAGRELRPRALGVRRVDLVRPGRVDPRGGAAAPAGRPPRLPAQLDARGALCPTADDGRSRRFSVRSAGCTGSTGRTPDEIEFQLGHGDWIRLLRANGFEVERPVESFRRTTRSTTSTTTRMRTGRGSGRAKRFGAPACAPADPRVDVAAAAGDPRAVAHPVRRGPARLRGGAAASIRSSTRGQGAIGRRDAGDRPVLGVDTEVLCDGRLFGKPATRRTRSEMLNALSGRTHEVVSGLCLRDAGVGGAAAR